MIWMSQSTLGGTNKARGSALEPDAEHNVSSPYHSGSLLPTFLNALWSVCVMHPEGALALLYLGSPPTQRWRRREAGVSFSCVPVASSVPSLGIIALHHRPLHTHISPLS